MSVGVAEQRLLARAASEPLVPTIDEARGAAALLVSLQRFRGYAAIVSRLTNAEIRCRRSSLRALSSVVI
jgi:hypothetical protein